MGTSRATTEGTNDPFDARTKRRLVGCAVGVPLLVFVWIVGTWWAMDESVRLSVSNEFALPLEGLVLLRGDGELVRSLPTLPDSSYFIQRLRPTDLEATSLRIVHASCAFDIDMSRVLEPTPFLRVEVVIDALTPSGVIVTSYVDRRQMLRELTPW